MREKADTFNNPYVRSSGVCARNSIEPLKPSAWQRESALTYADNLLVFVLGLATKF